ncbi:MAG: 50S ribosomal protein L30 [Actinomycetales bacterium]|nr:50S ribosomal protein L30 [Actinomycetales bacterium]
MSTVHITQVRSSIGALAAQRDTLRTLGLRRIGDTVSRPDTPEFRGMVRAVSHLVTVTTEDASPGPAGTDGITRGGRGK